MNCASFFSGIGGFDLGFDRAGLKTTVQCEIDHDCRSLLSTQFTNAIQIENILSINAAYRRVLEILPNPRRDYWARIFKLLRDADIFAGGFPCQDLSVAGARAGLAGGRSGLWFAFRRVVALFRPPLVVIENVPGLLSSQEGRDFDTLLNGLEGIGYGLAWRTLDSQYFGLAQRRERVFVVGSLGTMRFAEILFEPESLCWDSPPSREAREGVAPCVRGGTASGSNEPGNKVVGTLSARANGGGGLGTDFELGGGLVRTLTSGSGGGQVRQAASHNLNPQLQHEQGQERTGYGGAPPAIAFQTRIARNGRGNMGDKVNALQAQSGRTGKGDAAPCVAQPTGVRRLTPTECERLQGFPDGWTVGFSDSARYRMLGNAVSVPVAEWIGRRIVKTLK